MSVGIEWAFKLGRNDGHREGTRDAVAAMADSLIASGVKVPQIAEAMRAARRCAKCGEDWHPTFRCPLWD